MALETITHPFDRDISAGFQFVTAGKVLNGLEFSLPPPLSHTPARL
jgi:hypothetical protein